MLATDHHAFPPQTLYDPYPMARTHEVPKQGALQTFLTTVNNGAQECTHHLLKPIRPLHRHYLYHIARGIRRRQHALTSLDDTDLQAAADQLRVEAKKKGLSRAYAQQAFALVREATQRTLGFSHYNEQLMGGWVMWHGQIAEMETGQGKTVTATLPAVTAALAGAPVHIITVNDYLAQRDADSMGPIYRRLGLSVGVVTDDMSEAERRTAYRADITYCSNKTVVFDHLRDRLRMSAYESPLEQQLAQTDPSTASQPILRGLCFALVDEADSILIDEAITPLIISKSTAQPRKMVIYRRALQLAQQLQERDHFIVDHDRRQVHLTQDGRAHLTAQGEQFGGLWRNQLAREELVLQALKALYLFQCDRHYLVREGRIEIIDESTGRIMPDRSWERGLHQMIELKEGCETTDDRLSIARLSYQRFFRRYLRLAGMTGTAQEVRQELLATYGVQVVPIPTAQTVIRRTADDTITLTTDEKWRRLIAQIQTVHQQGRPVLIGTRSVEASDALSHQLKQAQLTHQLLNARQNKEEAAIIAAAGEKGRITVATNMAGRGTDIQLPEEVKALGGLHVIATERHESRRIDRQLMGRCGRQGDPGSAQAIISLEDELLMKNSPRWLWWLTRWSLQHLPSLGQWLAGPLVQVTQRIITHRQYQARCQVLQSDQQLTRTLAFSGQME